MSKLKNLIPQSGLAESRESHPMKNAGYPTDSEGGRITPNAHYIFSLLHVCIDNQNIMAYLPVEIIEKTLEQ